MLEVGMKCDCAAVSFLRDDSMRVKKIIKCFSAILVVAMMTNILSTAIAAEISITETRFVLPAAFSDNSLGTSAELNDKSDERLLYRDGVIRIFNYEQLLLLGSEIPVTDADYASAKIGTGNIIFDNEQPVTYSLDGDYEIAKNIRLPRHTAWQLPEGFSGNISGSVSEKKPLYDNASDTIFIYNPYQLSVMAMDNADVQPVLSGDSDSGTFGSGQPLTIDDESDIILTYSDSHNYVISVQFNSDTSQKPISVITKSTSAQKAPQGPLRAVNPQTDGRDFAGQVIKKIDGVTYILIGNESQLRAIGSGDEVFTAVYQTNYVVTWNYTGHVIDTDQNGDPIQLYGGDADLLQSQNGYRDYGFQQINSLTQAARYYVGVDQNTGQPYTDAVHATQNLNSLTEASWRTGEKYTKDANYIVFRDIDLGGSARPWTPLMFTGNMYGIKSVSGGKLWNGTSIGDSTLMNDRTTQNRPVISNVYVNNTSPVEVDKFIGIGFFATITNELNTANIGISGGTVHVENLELNNVEVHNTASTAKSTQTILSGLTSGLGWLVGGVVDLLTTALSFGSLKLTLRDTLSNLLNARAQDPTIFATGAFSGRVVGDVDIYNCAVTNTVTVDNVKSYTGGFVGYSNGTTEYSGLSQALGITVDALSSLLNVIPGLGLGDLITILLENALPVSQLIPTDYYSPKLRSCTVDGLTGQLGHESNNEPDTDYIGGFIGCQIGTRITDSEITDSSFTVAAENYGGGFTGLERDAEIKGTLDGVGIDLSSIIQRIHSQSVLMDCSIIDSTYQVTGENLLGGFVGAMTSSYAVDCLIDCDSDSVTVHGTGDYAGGFAGYSTVGWQSSLGRNENNEKSLLGTVRQLVTGLLSTDQAAGQKLLSLMGVSPSAILGCQMYFETLDVEAEGNFAGGIVGKGEGIYLGRSDQAAYGALAAWNSGTLKETPQNKPVILTGLNSVRAQESYAGGVAGYMGSAAFQGLLNDVVGLGDFIGFAVKDITLTGVDDGYAVKADDFNAGGGFGLAVGGTITNVKLNELQSVEADNHAGGFVGIAGPGELVGTGGLTVNLLGLDRVLEVSNLLNIGQGIEVHITDCDVTGIEDGYTVEATGTDSQNGVNQLTAAGFIADSNSTKITDSHCYELLSVTAADFHGYAGGFVGTSETGGLAEVANNDTTSVKALIQADGLLRAIGYLIPEYTNCTTNFVDGGYVDADIAGGFAADFESGTVDNSTISTVDDSQNPKWTHTMKELYDPDSVNATGDLQKQFAVINIDAVYGRTYGGGFGGKLRSGALASSGGGISILGDSSLGLNINIDDLLSVMNAYVPYIIHAGVYSENGFTVEASEIRTDDTDSGSAGGFAGLMSGAQISHCDVFRLKHTEVTPPSNLEAVSAPSYFDSSQSAYAVNGGHFAGGYVGKMDIGSAASLGSGLKVLGNSIQLTNALKALSVVVSTIEHSDVQGAGGGFSVISDGTDPDDGKVGMSGGYAGGIYGGHIQNSHCKNFYYIIGQEAAGGYVGNLEPGNTAELLGDGSILGSLIDFDDALASLVEDFVPTVRNSTTSCVPCGGAVRAHSPSDESHQRGCAGGYCGHNEGGHIWGLDTHTWQDQNNGVVTGRYFGHDREGEYTGEQHISTAWRIRSVYGYEYAGGFTGYMESADTADTGSIKLLGGLISANNLLNALSAVYPTETNTAVYGPLRNLDVLTWNLWVQYIGKNGGYGAELAREGAVSIPANPTSQQLQTAQAELDSKLSKYVYGCNVVAGRSVHETMLISEGGNAGGYVGFMVTGVITNGQSYDMKKIRAMRSAGGYAGRMQTGSAAEFGSVNLLGNTLNLNIGQLVSAVKIFVPTIKSGSVHGWQSGMTVTSYGTDFIHKCGYAGGYAGSAYGAQIWGNENKGNSPGTGCNVYNLRYVRGTNSAGGYVGIATAASVADVNTNASKGLLQRVLNTVISSPGDLASVLQATITTIRQAEVEPDNEDFGYVVEGLNGAPPKYAGGFAGYLEAAVIGNRKGGTTVTLNGLRRVDGLYYAGGFVGLADVGSLASVSGSGQQSTTILGLINAGSVDLLDIFRTYIYDTEVNGVDEGFTVSASTSDSEGLLGEVRYSGCAGGFAGGMMNGTIKRSDVTSLSTVTGLNYSGGFIGHAGKNGAVDVDDAAVSSLVGLTAGVLDIFGTVIDDCSVGGITNGFVVSSSEGDEPISGGFAGYADVSQIKNSNVTSLKQVYSDEIAGGFVGKTDMHYLIELEASSPLVQIVLGIVNVLVRALYVTNLEQLDLLRADSALLGLALLSDGDLLYVNLLGLKIGVSLVKSTEPGVSDTALITIGDSSIALPCDENGIDMNNQNAEVAVNLIKGNRTRVENCSVHGIAAGYDVYGGGAGNDNDGTGNKGFAGGFVGYNNEGKFSNNLMEYCDVVSGSAGMTGTFTGTTSLLSVYSFNNIYSIEGDNNRYSVYRQTELDTALTQNGEQIGSTAVQDTGTPITYNRFDVTYLAPPRYVSQAGQGQYNFFGLWEDAKLVSDASGSDAVDAEVYKSSSRAVLMLDIPTRPNEKSLIPEPAEAQDPCELMHLTIQKIWDDLDDRDGMRPEYIRVRIIQWETDQSGDFVAGTDTPYIDPAIIPDADTDGWFTLTRQDHALEGTATWERVIEGLPVYVTRGSDTIYYGYTVEEESVDGYAAGIAYSQDGFTAVITNRHRPILPVTGGTGDMLYIMIGAGIIIISVIIFRRKKPNGKMIADDHFRPPRAAP